jgi:hypothetical protein
MNRYKIRLDYHWNRLMLLPLPLARSCSCSWHSLPLLLLLLIINVDMHNVMLLHRFPLLMI